MYGVSVSRARASSAAAAERSNRSGDPITLHFEPHKLGYEPSRLADKAGKFTPVGDELGAFVSADEASYYALEEARRMMKLPDVDPDVRRGLADYVAKEMIKNRVVIRNKRRAAEFKLWILGKHKQLNHHSVTKWGAQPAVLTNPEASNFTQRALHTQYLFTVFAYKLFYKAPLLTLQESAWFFRYLVEPLQEWVYRRTQEDIDNGEKDTTPAKYWKYIADLMKKPDYAYPHPALDPVLNHNFWSFAYLYTPTGADLVIGKHEINDADIAAHLPELKAIERFTSLCDAKGGWDPLFVDREDARWDEARDLNPLAKGKQYRADTGGSQQVLRSDTRFIGEDELSAHMDPHAGTAAVGDPPGPAGKKTKVPATKEASQKTSAAAPPPAGDEPPEARPAAAVDKGKKKSAEAEAPSPAAAADPDDELEQRLAAAVEKKKKTAALETIAIGRRAMITKRKMDGARRRDADRERDRRQDEDRAAEAEKAPTAAVKGEPTDGDAVAAARPAATSTTGPAGAVVIDDDTPVMYSPGAEAQAWVKPDIELTPQQRYENLQQLLTAHYGDSPANAKGKAARKRIMESLAALGVNTQRLQKRIKEVNDEFANHNAHEKAILNNNDYLVDWLRHELGRVNDAGLPMYPNVPAEYLKDRRRLNPRDYGGSVDDDAAKNARPSSRPPAAARAHAVSSAAKGKAKAGR